MLVWVLVCGNYAGNDELEPAVRVRLVMDRTNYSHLKKAMASGDWVTQASVPRPRLTGRLDPALRGLATRRTAST